MLVCDLCEPYRNVRATIVRTLPLDVDIHGLGLPIEKWNVFSHVVFAGRLA